MNNRLEEIREHYYAQAETLIDVDCMQEGIKNEAPTVRKGSFLEDLRLCSIHNGTPTVQIPEWLWIFLLKACEAYNSWAEQQKNAA